MNVNTLSYWIAEAAASIMKNQKTFWSGVAIMTLALFLIAFFCIAYDAANGLMGTVEESQGKIEVFLNDIDEAQTERVKNSILGLSGVDEIVYISKEEAKERAKTRVPEGITEGVPDDIYPASFIVSISDLENANQIAMRIRNIEGVGEKENDVMVNENSELISKIAITVKVLSVTILLLTIVSSCFIVVNSIKLMVYSRRREISIMKYVGATDTFTKAPFVIEGLVIALVSAAVVILLTSIVCKALAGLAVDAPMFSFLSSADDLMATISIILLVIGAGIGTIGSSISINKYLDV